MPECHHSTPQSQGKAASRLPSHLQNTPQSPAPAPVLISQVQHADKSTPVQHWAPRQIDRAISAQEWEGLALTAELNGQHEGRQRQPAMRNSLQGGTICDAQSWPQYLKLPEAESYESFTLLAHAFRQWHSHAENEQLVRYELCSSNCSLLHDLPVFSSSRQLL